MANILELAQLCNAAYDNTPLFQDLPSGSLSGSTWEALPISSGLGTDTVPADDYHAIAYVNTTTQEVVIANRGTRPDHPIDIFNDARIADEGAFRAQGDALAYAKAVLNYMKVHYQGYSLVETGHSLGGNEAQYVVANLIDQGNAYAAGTTPVSGLTSVSGVTFNAPGVGSYLRPSNAPTNWPATYPILNLYAQGDWIHDAGGQHLGTMAVIDSGPTLGQEVEDFLEGAVAGALTGGPGGALAAGGAYLAKEVYDAHSIQGLVTYLSGNPSIGGETPQNYTATPSPSTGPTVTAGTAGSFGVSDGAGTTIGWQPNSDQTVTVSAMVGNSVPGLADPAALNQELTNIGNVTLTGVELGQDVSGLVASTNINGSVDGSSITLAGSGTSNSFLLPLVNEQYFYNVPTGTTATETITSPNGQGTVWVGETQLTGGTLDTSAAYTWIDGHGTQYQFTANGAGQNVGTLTITQGLLGSTAGNSIVIKNFDLNQAETSPNGYLGITFDQQVALSAGPGAPDSFASGDYAPAGVSVTTANGATSPSLTVNLSGATDAAQQVTLNFTGANTAGFMVDTGSTLLPITNGAVTLTVPAGQDSLTVGLIATQTLYTNQTLDVTAALPNAPAGTPAGNTMQVNFAASEIAQSFGPIAPSSTSSGGDFFFPNGGNDSIVGTSGNDTVYGNAGPGDCIIIGNGGQDNFSAFNNNNQIYANQQESLAAALSLAATQTATGLPGDLFDVGDSYNIDTQTGSFGENTLVGGTGNDQFYLGGGADVVVCGPGNDTIEGGLLLVATAQGEAIESSGGYNTGSITNETPLDSSGTALGIGNETIFGGSGKDLIQGSNGDNYIDVGSGNSTVYSGAGNDTIYAGTGNSTITGQGGNNFIEGESGNDLIVGGAGNNTIIGGSGNDSIAAGGGGASELTQKWGDNYVYGGSGNSLIEGTGGNDTLIAGSGNTTVLGGAGSELIEGGSGQSVLVSGSTATQGSDTLIAGSGNNSLYGGAGTDVLYGGSGSDFIQGGSGTETIYAGDGGTAGAATVIEAGSGATTVYGGVGTDQIDGGSGQDSLVAGSGDATLQGGSGNDVLEAGAGNDLLIAGAGQDTLYGGVGSATLEGGSGDAVFVAGSGADTFIGGSGTNTYELDAGFGNVLIEPGSVNDVLQFGTGVSLADLTVTGTLDAAGAPVLEIAANTGGSVDIVGGLLNGGLAQVEVGGVSYSLAQLALAASNGDNFSPGANGNLTYSAITGDSLTGGTGNDTLVAFAADTTLSGGGGNTLFMVNDPTDVVTEQTAGLKDVIDSSVSYVLPQNVDSLTLTGNANLTATGNDQTDVLTANSGSDTLIAGTGVATMAGGAGNDTFVVNNSADVIEAQASGVNTVLSSANYVAPEYVQNLTLTGNNNLTATGNSESGVLTANSGNDTLIAGSGIDTLMGGAGSDTFVVNSAADVVQAQASGVNTVETSVSLTAPNNVRNLIGTGSAPLNLVGGYLTGSTVVANSGNDTLRGGGRQRHPRGRKWT